MATVSPAFNTKNCHFLIQLHDLTLYNFSGYLAEGGMEFSTNLGDFNVFEDDWTYRLAGKKDASGTLNIVGSTGAGSMLRWAKDWWFSHHAEARRIVMSLPDSSVGSERVDGHFMLETMPWQAQASEAGPFIVSLTVQATGEIIPSIVGS